jgi:hypothetical protein
MIILIISSILSCKKDDPSPPSPNGKIIIEFEHFVDGEPLKIDTMIYTNEAGNPYLVNEIQYFVSDVTLGYENSGDVVINAWKDLHYVDTDILSTHVWQVFDELEPGEVKDISFTFGINEEKNQSLMYSDPPESLMFWPEYLGGGYHYLKLNGKWQAEDKVIKPFNFHLGIGQNYDNDGNITGFIHNHFKVTGLEGPFEIKEGETTTIRIRMNIENWFRNPHTYNHDEWGGDIMQKQEAMKLGCENGADVFTISTE